MMQILQPVLDLDVFFAHVHAASSRVLMLDYDGTWRHFMRTRRRPGLIPKYRRCSMPSSRRVRHGWLS